MNLTKSVRQLAVDMNMAPDWFDTNGYDDLRCIIFFVGLGSMLDVVWGGARDAAACPHHFLAKLPTSSTDLDAGSAVTISNIIFHR